MALFSRRRNTQQLQRTEVMDRRRFLWLGGRRHMDLPYLLPKDMGEVHRLDFQHYLLRFALKGNYAAPVGEPTSILDVGCGTGRWAMEMASQFPRANVIGVDLVPPPSEDQQVLGNGLMRRPENFAFVAGDVFKGLPFESGSFDFVHQRLLYAALPLAQWQPVVNELARVTRPGGWVELVEAGIIEGQGPARDDLMRWGIAACDVRGIDIQIGRSIDAFLRSAGLTNIARHAIQLPLGRRGGRLGQMAATNLVSVMQALRGAVTAAGIATEQDYDRAVDALRFEIEHYEYVWPVYVSYGQRKQ